MHYVSSSPCVKSGAPPPDVAPAFCRNFARMRTHSRGKSEDRHVEHKLLMEKGIQRRDKNKWNGGGSRGAQIPRLDHIHDIRVLSLHILHAGMITEGRNVCLSQSRVTLVVVQEELNILLILPLQEVRLICFLHRPCMGLFRRITTVAKSAT